MRKEECIKTNWGTRSAENHWDWHCMSPNVTRYFRATPNLVKYRRTSSPLGQGRLPLTMGREGGVWRQALLITSRPVLSAVSRPNLLTRPTDQYPRYRHGRGPFRYRWPLSAWGITDRPTHQYPWPSGYRHGRGSESGALTQIPLSTALPKDADQTPDWLPKQPEEDKRVNAPLRGKPGYDGEC